MFIFIKYSTSLLSHFEDLTSKFLFHKHLQWTHATESSADGTDGHRVFILLTISDPAGSWHTGVDVSTGVAGGGL